MKKLIRFVHIAFDALLALLIIAAVALTAGAVVGALGAMFGALVAVTVGSKSITVVSSIMFWCAGGVTTVAMFAIMLFNTLEIATENAKKIRQAQDELNN